MRINPVQFKKPLEMRGFSLIEVLVALLVLSVGLLGLALLQVQGMRYNSNSYQRTQATVLAYEIIDRIRTNSKNARTNGAYCLDVPAPTDPCKTIKAPATLNTCGDTGGCNTDIDVAKYDISKWYTLLEKHLPYAGHPGGAPSIERKKTTTPYGIIVDLYTITINWMERDIPMTQKWEVEL